MGPLYPLVAQLVTCLTADPGVTSLIMAWSHTFLVIDHEMISSGIPLIQEGASLPRKKEWLGELTVPT